MDFQEDIKPTQDTINKMSKDLDIINNPNAIKDHYEEIKNPKPMEGKKTINNGQNTVPNFELIDILTLGITYLIKLMTQARKDHENFKQEEPQIANNCRNNNINYVQDNEKDHIKDVTKGIGLYHDINDLNKKMQQNPKDQNIQKEIEEKTASLNKMCKNNRTLDNLINSKNDTCAMAQGTFHAGVFASKVNEKGEKEFFVIDQGGRKVPGSGFPDDDEMSKAGINVMQVASTNGMCVATAHAGLKEISTGGLNNFLEQYAGCVKQTSREKVKVNEINNTMQQNISQNKQSNVEQTKQNKINISNIHDINDKTKTNKNEVKQVASKEKTIQVYFDGMPKTENKKYDTKMQITNVDKTTENKITNNVNISKAQNQQQGYAR